MAERSDKPTVFQPGETITVRINETVDHPSHYRIAFNPDGDDFEDPTSIDDNTGDHPHVLMDNIEDADEAVQEVEVTLPDVECENCTLQLIQVMYDKQLNGFGGNDGIPPDNNDLYYACADIALRAEGSDDAVDDEVDDAADDATDDEADDDVEQQASEDVEMSDAGMPSSSSSSPSGGSGRETCSIGRPAAGSAGVPWALLLALGFVWRARRASVARHGAGHDGYR